MITLMNKFKIPTLLGLGVIFIGIGFGVILVLREQTFISQASPDTNPEIIISNISENSASLSWQTDAAIASFVTYGQSNSNEYTVRDDKDTKSPQAHKSHYFTIKNLLPQITYQLKVVSGKRPSDISTFTTASHPTMQNGFAPIIGTVLDKDTPLDEGVVYFSTNTASIQSAEIKNGNFIIPVSQIRKSDLSDVYPLNEGTIAKITIISPKGEVSTLFKLKPSGVSLPPLKLGQNLDLTTPEQTPQPTPTTDDLDKFDLNGDGLINVNDHSLVLKNFGKNPKEKKADLNSDGVVDQKDLDLMSKQINQ